MTFEEITTWLSLLITEDATDTQDDDRAAARRVEEALELLRDPEGLAMLTGQLERDQGIMIQNAIYDEQSGPVPECYGVVRGRDYS